MPEEITKKQGIFIELDALLDTRLSTLYSIGPDAVVDSLTKNYFSRRIDTFEGVDKKVFSEIYKARDKVTLSNAVVTKAIGFVKELILLTTSQAIKTPFHTGAKLIINTYPYDLDESEVNAIVEGVVYAIDAACDVQAVSMSLKDLTPRYCKDNLGYMFLYDYIPWLEQQGYNFKDLPCPEIMVIVPGIYFTEEEPTKQEMTEAIQSFMHPLRAMEFVSAYYIDLKLYDIDLFCANIKVQEVKEEDIKENTT